MGPLCERVVTMNSSQVSYFTLSGYTEIGVLKYLFFLILLCFYLVIICANVLLILVIGANRSLHEPMYMFLCSLFVNELYGSTGLLPFLMLQILCDVHTVHAPLCFLQIFCLYSYVNVEFYNLAAMSYDRYLAICLPLQYNTRMTAQRVLALVAFSWIFPFLSVVLMIALNASLRLCGNIVHRLYCDNYSVVKLACENNTASNVYGLVYTFTVLVSLAAVNLYTYMRILQVCYSGSKQTREKAFSTCFPHLASLFIFSCGCFLEVIQSRFDMSHVPEAFRLLLSLFFLICQPFLNPVIYGLNMSKIRTIFRHFLLR